MNEYEQLQTTSAPTWAQAFDKRCQEYWVAEGEALPLAEITEWFAYAIEQGYQFGLQRLGETGDTLAAGLEHMCDEFMRAGWEDDIAAWHRLRGAKK